MAKAKPTKGTKGSPNKHLSARINFLQQAALHLAESHSGKGVQESPRHSGDLQMHDDSKTTMNHNDHPPNGLAAHLALQLRQVALKSQIRLQHSTKYFSCKVCHAVLVDGYTCKNYTENLSRGGMKPHAALAVHECKTCGTKKRFPLNSARQSRKSKRTVVALPTEMLQQVEDSPNIPPA
ncbi:hypothetical protein CLAFUW4_01645 [Fulvia fulva]|uniref:Uncharacterized protein n=1 Tax=Passalora fulva TaxID=5499 RepID=A0A9Q8L7A4_PASFU|nr:uncharacterized protein CLAFUR5_01644 [Fulvia fulva]KAK4635500.1 hypothetical protein CLAFUR4_01643 [Fulvia fulva]KAK4637354.1 hypothetical protein CLAFUR0_01644 [Fulvia fulva]UJO11513.1 hypothetical protein CLAFUR5_01644 [Fulvia fulva]WPV10327.1 hypothetical protein CLAFUW4_01645 [Fulvia fulva]WPV23894.1 hypothetical protein CLAFUW7_01647 [Fulvia fulva]